MSIIVWGSHGANVCRGVVQDCCPTCVGVYPFSVVDLFETDHVYGVATSRPRWVSTSRTCGGCSNWFTAHDRSYQDALSIRTASTLSMLDRAERTNVLLHQALIGLDAAKLASRADGHRWLGPDDSTLPIGHALEWLEWLLLADYPVRELAAYAGNSGDMTPEERSELVAAIEQQVRSHGGQWKPHPG